MKTSLHSLKPLLKSKLLWGGVAWVVLFPIAYNSMTTRIDLTMDKSLPYTVWLTQKPFSGDKHHFVMFKPTVHNKYTLKVGYFVKQITCSGGQSLLVTEDKQYYCDGHFIGRAQERDKDGIPVRNFTFNGVIPVGSYFVEGTHPRSYDSRYFGFVREEQIDRGATPLW